MLSWSDYRQWLGEIAVSNLTPQVNAPELADLSTDSRSIRPGQWFVPLEGPNFDGHQYIEEAMTRGASGFFFKSDKRGYLPQRLSGFGFEVTDTLRAFQLAASGWRSTLKSLRLVALTGSAGKTTTKEMLASVLRADGPTFATLASFNNEIGVPKSLQQLSPELRYAVLEFGARMPGNIRFLCEMAAPDVVGLLNVGTAHLGVFGSRENLLDTKLEIFRDSPAHATQIAYCDDPRILENAEKTGKKTITFGTSPSADVRLLTSEWLTDGSMRIRLRLPSKGEISFTVGIAHEAFPINTAAAAAMALAAGASVDSITRGLSSFKGIKGRYHVQRLGNVTVVDDTYNANPESMAVGLKTVARAFNGKRIVLILGDMLELGESSAEAHDKLGREQVAHMNPSQLITVGPEAQRIARSAQVAGLNAGKIRTFENIGDLLNAGLDFPALGDVIYAKGSNSIKLAQIIDKIVAVSK